MRSVLAVFFVFCVSALSAIAAGRDPATLDIRVAPLVQTRWSQNYLTVKTEPAFNLYTPSNYPCGCVAMAFLQVIHSWRHPAELPGKTAVFLNWVEGAREYIELMGGAYDWAAMPLGGADCKTAYQRECLGRIGHDVAVALRTNFRPQASGAWGDIAPDVLVNTFGYAFARSFDRIDNTYFTEDRPLAALEPYRNAILASLDGGMSVVAGVRSAQGYNHEFVIDGYGIDADDGNRIYCHVNFGWAGQDDGWYDLMGGATAVTSYSFNAFDDVIYNIHPTKKGDVVSGRVFDETGAPSASAKVVLINSRGKTVDTARTSSNGIYALRFTDAGNYTVSASAGGAGASRAITLVAGKNVVGKVDDDANPWIYDYDTKKGTAGVVANLWGVDLTLVAGGGGDDGGDEEESPYDATAAAAVFDGSISAGGAITGTIQAKVGKANKKTSVSKVTASVVRAGSAKKLSYKGEMGRDGRAVLTCAGAAAMELYFGRTTLSGRAGAETVSGARNKFSSKDKTEKAEAAALLAGVPKALTAAWTAPGGRLCASLAIGSKGKVKATVFAPDGAQATATAQLVAAADGSWSIGAVNAKKVPFAFLFECEGGRYSLAGVSDATAAEPGTLRSGAAFSIDKAALAAVLDDASFSRWYPDGASVAQIGAKWIVADGAKAGKVAFVKGTQTVDETKAGENPAALKLSYAAKTGIFKGSFKAYILANGKPKAVAVKVAGVLAGGEGYGAATVKKPAGAVEIEIK